MATESALESLPPEIQLQLLVNANTPNDLHALIQASPRLYQLYLLNKNLALSAVACRNIHCAVITDALVFAKISQFEKPLSRNTVIELLETYPSGLQEEPIMTTPMSVTLCQLASNISFFIEDYARNTLPIMEGLGRSLDFHILPSYPAEASASFSKLSNSETGRLQRAFCRFEIYRTLFGRCSSEFDHVTRQCANEPSLKAVEQASEFFGRFPDFQVTEINCVRDYLYRRLRGICGQLEDKAASTLPPETFMFDRDGDWESEEWASGVWLFTESGKYYQTQHIEHLMSLGLAYVRRIFESTGEEQKNLFIRHSNAIIHHLETEFITRAVDLLEPIPARRGRTLLAETDPPFVYEHNPDVELDIPDAWQWANPLAPPLCLTEKHQKGLRDWGFVFWDFDRLRKSGILERSSHDVLQIDFDEYEAEHTPSVQERLLGPSSPPEDYDDEYDGLEEDDLGYDSPMDDSSGDDCPGDDNLGDGNPGVEIHGVENPNSPGDDNPGDGNPEVDNHEVEKPEDDSPEDTTITLKTIALKVIAIVGQTLKSVVSPREDSHE